MKTVVIIFMVVATVLALATLAYVVIDALHEMHTKDRAQDEKKDVT